ncbi:transport integral membrane protein [Pilimelia terevasa]|uniref:Transport integral membrane protein n=1 Tax=Pilimelia terevasa TaxID=53372 RepID=A0A8J3BJV3_9ACTN|nr:copper resistance protein CopC [Pilimelia terevasa]GGK16029.1 transport integral membrane protein [Pilimelia terevasa]
MTDSTRSLPRGPGPAPRGPRRGLRRVLALLGAAAALAVAALLPATPASAHATVVGTNPKAGSVIPTAPAQVTVEFSEPVSMVSEKIRVIGPDGKRHDAEDPRTEGSRVTIPMRPDAPNGTYLVSYRIISADSHPVPGGFTYSVGAPSANPPKLTDAAAEVDPWVRGAVSLSKFAGYAGLVLVVGATLVLGLLWPQRLDRRSPTRLAWWGLGTVAFATVLALVVQAPYRSGRGLFSVSAADLQQVLANEFGTGHLIRLGVIAAVAFLLPPILGGRATKVDAIPAVVLAIIGMGTWPISGHAAASVLPYVSVIADSFHVAGAAIWIGGLVMLFGYLLRQANEVELGAILPIWSRWAMLAVAAVVLAGTVQGLLEVSSLDGLFGTAYGQLLLVKIVLFLLVVGAATYARRLVDEAGTAAAPRRLRQVVLAEVVGTVLVLGVSSVLVQTAPARSATAEGELGAGLPFSGTAVTSLFTLQVELSPARPGPNDLHLYAYTADGQAKNVIEWKATATLPSAGVEEVAIPMVKLTDNHASGQFSPPTAGQWRMKFTARTSDIDEATVTVTVPVS